VECAAHGRRFPLSMTRRILHWLLAALLVGLVGCDHATKIAARATLGDGRVITLIPRFLDLRYAENRGTAFSILDGARGSGTMILLVVVSLVAIAAIGAYWWRVRRNGATTQLACALVVAGAIGNLVDRAVRGFVVDFVHLHHWPVFNVADVSITIGVAMLMVVSIARARSPGAPSS
jgi:signal peptidase II